MNYHDLVDVILGVLVLGILFYLLILTRQIAMLHLRIQPTGARIVDMGPAIGDQLSPRRTEDINGQSVQLVGDQRARLVLFVSPNCPACHALIPAVKAVARSYQHGADAYDVVLVTTFEDVEANRTYIQRFGLTRIPYVVSAALGAEWGIWGARRTLLSLITPVL